jgi:hypothetical protein
MKRPLPRRWTPDWTDIPEPSVEYLLQEAKEHLQGTIDLGINADQRSAALCGVFGGGAFAMFAVSATVFTISRPNMTLIYSALLPGILLLIACLLCARAAAPEDFYGPGYEPALLIASASDPIWMKRYVIEDIQYRIEANRAEINREARLVKWAFRVAVTAVLAGTALFLLAFYQGA